MNETPKKPLLPKKIKDSIYVHNITNSNFEIYAKLLSQHPQNFKLLRPARDGINLSFLEPKQKIEQYHENQNTDYYKSFIENNAAKRLIEFSFNESEILTNLKFTSKISYPNLTEFAENQNLILNLVQQSIYDDNIGESLLEKTALEKIRNKITLCNIFNNKDFFANHIGKEDKIEFPSLSKIIPFKGNICILVFENNTIALISEKQLLAAYYTPAPQKTLNPIHSTVQVAAEKEDNLAIETSKPKEDEINPFSNSIKHIFLPPLTPNKRKAGKNDLNEKTKRNKTEEKNATEKTENKNNAEDYILEDSKFQHF